METLIKNISEYKGQEATLKFTGLKATGAFAEHVRSGSRGNQAQLMRMIVSPVATTGAKRGVSPLTIRNSFSQGLTPGEYFASALDIVAKISAECEGVDMDLPCGL